jgi:hypothetical protein
MGTIALSQNTSLDGVIQLDGLMQSTGPTDVPFEHTGWVFDDIDRGPEGGRFNYEEEFGLEQAQHAEVSCSDGSPTRPCRPTGPRRKVGSPPG